MPGLGGGTGSRPRGSGAGPPCAGPPLSDRAIARIGHKGADAIAPGNTRESFDAALRAGVDMIEFDVLRLEDGRLVLAHDFEDAAGRDPVGLEEGLGHLAGRAYAGIDLVLDLKLPGYEREVVAALAGRGLADRALVSTQHEQSLDRLGEVAPGIPRGWSVPRVRRDYTKTVLALPAYGVARYLRARLPGRAAAMLHDGRCEAIVAHWLLVGAALVRAVRREGGRLFVWTVDDRRRIDRLEGLGVDGVITNDPRLFAARAADPPGPLEAAPG